MRKYIRKYIPEIALSLIGIGVAGVIALLGHTTLALIISIAFILIGIVLFLFHIKGKAILKYIRSIKKTHKIMVLIIIALVILLVIPSIMEYNQIKEEKLYEEQKQYTEMINQLQNDATIYIANKQFERAIETFNTLVQKVNKEEDPSIYTYAKYMIGKCELDLSLETKDGKEDMLLKAITQFSEVYEEGMTESNKIYYARALEDLGYSYYSLSEIKDKEINLEASKQFYDKALAIYDSDKRLTADSARVAADRDRIIYMLNELHKNILNNKGE